MLDTGDLVDWGTPAEAALAGQIAGLGVPYVYVKGNHDSAGIAAAVARQPNAVVLDAGDPPREVAGLRFVGMADPRFTPDKTTGDDHAAHRVGEAAEVFAATLRAQQSDADIALVHAPAAGRALAGLVPLVLAGDIHRRACAATATPRCSRRAVPAARACAASSRTRPRPSCCRCCSSTGRHGGCGASTR